MSQLDQLKLLLGITDSLKDAILQFVLDRAESAVKNYCNIIEIPSGLNDVILAIAIKLYRIENLGSEEHGSTVKSITVGDTTTSFESNASKDRTRELLNGFETDLAPFRKVKW
ncbi:phage head-tail connector protein [Thermotalea metallivorans]|uniref:Phage gp6-like head-tail connector protein n=1 Tax=Thermotalea metallivorans TaxID=520762 RepID=A0A140LCK7_9FIRM|nr:phage head-tail connector protein [Thermotalea metallivorans]KXG78282.1 hypothetical protein AN619_02570 [Thermotalea metallivorans]